MKYFKYLIYILCLVFAFAGFKIYSVYYPQFISELKAQAQKKYDIELNFASLQLSSFSPLGIKVNQLILKKNHQFDIEAQSIELKISNLFELLQNKSKKPVIDLAVNDFKIEGTLTKNNNTLDNNTSNSSSKILVTSLEEVIPKNPYIQNIKINIALIDGLVSVKKIQKKL